jgi:hypothetical protein
MGIDNGPGIQELKINIAPKTKSVGSEKPVVDIGKEIDKFPMHGHDDHSEMNLSDETLIKEGVDHDPIFDVHFQGHEDHSEMKLHDLDFDKKPNDRPSVPKKSKL